MLLAVAGLSALSPTLIARADRGLGRPPRGRPGPAQAETAKLVEQARSHFDAGNQHYAAGRYTEAIQQFQAGYALVPRPNFLVNLGQAYRKLGDLARAKESYVAYVRALPQNSALRDQALQVLAEIEVQLQEQKGSAPTPTPERAATPATADQPGRHADTDTAAAPESHRRQARTWRPWRWPAAGWRWPGPDWRSSYGPRTPATSLTALDRRASRSIPQLDQRGRRDQRIGIGLLSAGGAALATAILLYR